MPRKTRAQLQAEIKALKPTTNGTAVAPKRRANGTWMPGYSGAAGLDVARSRRQLNSMTIEGLTDAYRRGGQQAIDKVMRNAPAQFLKMLVLLVPRELEVTHAGGVKGMSDEAIAQAIEAIEAMLARRSGEGAKVIEGAASPGTPTGAGGAEEPSATPT